MMWFADIYCDLRWVSDRNGVLGPKRMEFVGGKSDSLGIEIEFHLYGDQEKIRHVRVLMHTNDLHVAQACLNLNIQHWVAALEVSVMMETNRPFQTMRLPGSQAFVVGYKQAPDHIPVLFDPLPPKLDYERVACGLVA